MSSFDPLQIAWAAGFFDGEGSTIAYFPNKKQSRYLRVRATVPQRGDGEIPEVLKRFQIATLGMGKIVGPNEHGIYVWQTRGFEETQATIALLWRYVGPIKRSQASAALKEALDGYRSGRLKARASRLERNDHVLHASAGSPPPKDDDVERAWAAGFLDAEGCFGLAQSAKRKNGPQWFKIRASATQHGEVGVPADVLKRLQAVFGGRGRIERHGDPDDYRWLVEGIDGVEYVLRRTEPWLGVVKRTQAAKALRGFRNQVRLKGDATHCVRGHAYSGVALRGGRLRRICRECSLLYRLRRQTVKPIRPRG